MGYEFKVYRNDVVLEVDGSSRNYGRDFITTFPIVMWYANTQFGQRNLFDNFDLLPSIKKKPDISDNQAGNLATLVSSVLSASVSMPKKFEGDNGVNTDLDHWNISNFHSSDTKYNIIILSGSLDVWKNGAPDVSVEDYLVSTEFAEKYFQMIGEFDEMDPFRQMIKYVYKRLKEEGD